MADATLLLETSPLGSTESTSDKGVLTVLESISAQLDQLETQSRKITSEYAHIEEQLRLAAQVQRDLLPEPDLPLNGASIHALFRPVDRVSGDIYDVVRLDEQRVGISIADATGHGIPAALLTVFIKQTFRGKEITSEGYRLVPPHEILHRLNNVIFGAGLSQCRFVTALHAVFDEKDRTLTLARGGTPYPVLFRRHETPRLIESRGGLVGAFGSGDFETITVQLEAGDRVLLYTDGLEALLLGRATDSQSLDFIQTPWCASLAGGNVEESFDAIRERAAAIDEGDWYPDDITAVVLQVE